MLGASSKEEIRSPGTDHVPTLAPAPEGLSIRRAERWLGLPPGAWHRRKLYALRLNARTYAVVAGICLPLGLGLAWHGASEIDRAAWF